MARHGSGVAEALPPRPDWRPVCKGSQRSSLAHTSPHCRTGGSHGGNSPPTSLPDQNPKTPFQTWGAGPDPSLPHKNCSAAPEHSVIDVWVWGHTWQVLRDHSWWHSGNIRGAGDCMQAPSCWTGLSLGLRSLPIRPHTRPPPSLHRAQIRVPLSDGVLGVTETTY